MDDKGKMGKAEEERRTTVTDEGWEQTDHNLYRFKNWFCFIEQAGTIRSVNLYHYSKEHRAYVFVGKYFDFKKIVKVIEEAEREEDGKAAKA